MSYYDDASIMFIGGAATGVDGKAGTAKPINGGSPLYVTRGSNLTATRVDSNGLIEKGRENLLLQSNQFDTTWSTPNADVTPNQSGYDGSTDAWLLESDSDGASRRVQQTTTASGVHTFSVYAKAGSVNHIALYAFGANSGRFFDLNPSTTGSRIGSHFVSTPIDSKIEDIGGGWFRCSIVVDWSSSGAWIYPIATDGTSITTAGDNIYIQDAQLEQGLVATEYIESGATTGLSSYTTSADYTIQDSDDGYYLRVSQVETNTEGTDIAESIPTAFIATQETLAITNFTSRVEADGGSVESGSCLETDLTFLMNNP